MGEVYARVREPFHPKTTTILPRVGTLLATPQLTGIPEGAIVRPADHEEVSQ